MSVKRILESATISPAVLRPNPGRARYAREQGSMADLNAEERSADHGRRADLVSIDDLESPEWNIAASVRPAALGRRTHSQNYRGVLRRAGCCHYGQGKWYSRAETLPRLGVRALLRKDACDLEEFRPDRQGSE